MLTYIHLEGSRIHLGGGLRVLSTSGGRSGEKLRVLKNDAPKEPTVYMYIHSIYIYIYIYTYMYITVSLSRNSPDRI